MATYTENYGLSLPGQDEAPDIDVINQNMMIIDEALKKASNPPKEIIYKSEDGGFPQTGKDRTLYVDDTISPALMYIWNGSSYVPAGGTGGGSGDDTFDVSFTLSAEGWAGSSAPYAQTASIPGMTSGKAVVYALVSESAQPTAEEQADYQLISGLSQNTDSVTFYADAIPAGDMVIRAFCGAGTEEAADLSVIAAPFSAQKDYTTGERCINEGELWKFTDNKPAGAWDSTKVDSTTVDAELAELQGEVDELNSRISVTGERTNLISMSAPGTQNVDFTQYKKLRIAVSAANIYGNVMFLDTDVLSEASEIMWLYAGWLDTDNYSVIAGFTISKSAFTLSELRTSQGATNPNISVIGIS